MHIAVTPRGGGTRRRVLYICCGLYIETERFRSLLYAHAYACMCMCIMHIAAMHVSQVACELPHACSLRSHDMNVDAFHERQASNRAGRVRPCASLLLCRLHFPTEFLGSVAKSCMPPKALSRFADERGAG